MIQDFSKMEGLDGVETFSPGIIETAQRFCEGDPIISTKTVKNYLKSASCVISHLDETMQFESIDPTLVKIVVHFLKLKDERNRDGSISRRMLGYHARVAYTLNEQIERDVYWDNAQVVNTLITLNFNKLSVIEYYQQRIPLWVMLGEMSDPNANFFDNEGQAFNELFLQIEEDIQIPFPPVARAYDEEAPSLFDQIKASANKSAP